MRPPSKDRTALTLEAVGGASAFREAGRRHAVL